MPRFRASSDARPLAVVVTMTPWNEPPRIRHQITRQLTRFYNVLYVELTLSATSGLESLHSVDDCLLIYSPRGLSALERKLRDNLELFRRFYSSLYARRIEGVVRELGYSTAVLVNFRYDFPEIMSSASFRPRVYFCNDEFQGQGRLWTRTMYRRAERRVMELADLCLAVSVPLLSKLQAAARRAELFLPGHEFDIPAGALDETEARPRTKPIRVCFMGFINARLRIDWLDALAEQPDVELTLVGPVEQREEYTALLSRTNVVHRDTVVGAALRECLTSCDVLLMPYDARQPGIRAISAPNKLFQYLACGRPVVCTDLPALLELPPKFMYVANDGAGFVQAVRRAFDEDDAAATRMRLEYAHRNSWTVRGDALHTLLRLCAE